MESGKFQTLFGMRFCRDDKAGYFRNGTHQKLAHRHVWEMERGAIPPGWHVHHIDRDRGNNAIENLLCLSEEGHKQLHIDEDESFERRAQRAAWFIRHAHPKAKDWHQSEAGREWHRQHAIRSAEQMEARDYVCEQCGASFQTKPFGKNRFCSNGCKSAWRRASGADDETRSCAECGAPFTANRYKATKTCSTACTNRHRKSVEAMTASLVREPDGRYAKGKSSKAPPKP